VSRHSLSVTGAFCTYYRDGTIRRTEAVPVQKTGTREMEGFHARLLSPRRLAETCNAHEFYREEMILRLLLLSVDAL